MGKKMVLSFPKMLLVFVPDIRKRNLLEFISNLRGRLYALEKPYKDPEPAYGFSI